jgi:hypothetical protein
MTPVVDSDDQSLGILVDRLEQVSVVGHARIATVLDVPREVWIEIFSYLPRDISTSLLNIALVCRNFKDAVQPLMYREIGFQSTSNFPLDRDINLFQGLVELFRKSPALDGYV